MKPISWIRTTFLKCFVHYPQTCDVKRSNAQHTGQTGLEKRQMQYLKNSESKGVSEVL